MFLQAISTGLPLLQNLTLLIITLVAFVHAAIARKTTHLAVLRALWNLAKAGQLKDFIASRGEPTLPLSLQKQVGRRPLPACCVYAMSMPSSIPMMGIIAPSRHAAC